MDCPVCLEEFKPPILMLNCGHNLCESCVNQLTNQSDDHEWPCPICRKVQFKYQYIPRNFLAEQSLEQGFSRSKSVNAIQCEQHGKRITLYCKSHDKLLCLTCHLKKTCSADGCDLIDMDDYKTFKDTRIDTHEIKIRIDREAKKHIDRVMKAKETISAQYADKQIEMNNISADFNKLLGLDDSVESSNLGTSSPKSQPLIGLIFAPKSRPEIIGNYSLHFQSDKIAFLNFKSSKSKLATNELIRDVYPEKQFDQFTVNNSLFSGIIKWKGDKRPSWSKQGCDQWRFELRFDEVQVINLRNRNLNRTLVFSSSKVWCRKAIS